MPTELSSSETARRPPLSAAPTLTKPEGAPPQEQEHLPCPRCDSTNTKFCYYNNYNFSQPRHFCKSCRRYWTHGGTLRDIPIGGGTRRNAKRSRTSATTAASFVGPDNNIDDLPLHSTPVLVPLTASQGFPVHFGGGGDGKGSGGCGSGALGGSFTSLLSAPGPAGILTLGRFGHGLGHGLEDMECGLGRGLWSFPGIGDGGAGVGGHVGGHVGVTVTAGLDNTWQFESGPENCFTGGDCFSWPELAISTPANGFK